MPLPDHGIPAAPAQMAEILDCLRTALHEGRTVYLHCRAGIGRTGMAIGCLLAENGHGGEAALEELNRLWQQSARSRQWVSIPETDAQSDYVRTWSRAVADFDPLLDPATLAAVRGVRERYLGALLGLAVGDALGVTTQFRRPGRFTPLGDLLGGGPFDLPRGAWSDDTAMSLCLAESLLEQGGFEARDQVARYRRWQKEGYLSATGQCVGITAGTARALARGAVAPPVLLRLPRPGGPGPRAALARAGRWCCITLPTAKRRRRRPRKPPAPPARHRWCSRPAGPWPQPCTRPLAGAAKPQILAAAEALVGQSPAARPRSARRARHRRRWPPPSDCFARTHNFRDAVLAAANLGGDADVVAGAAGALAGAHYTAGAIPTMWRNSLMKLQLLESFADRLLDPRPGPARQLRRRAARRGARGSRQPAPGCRKLAARVPLVSFPTPADVHDSRPWPHCTRRTPASARARIARVDAAVRRRAAARCASAI